MNYFSCRNWCSWLTTLSCLILVAQGKANAQQEMPIDVTSPSPFRQYDKVEITGSSIVRKEQTQALPVMVFSREDIRRTGLKNMAEVVQALPSMSNFVEPSQLGMIAGGYSNAAIHGLPAGTLVLVNGLRMAPFGRPTVVGPERSSVDLQTLPLVDVERIEVLTDGASSLYGTDAIAGVVNIILRSSRKDLEIRADLSHPKGGRGQDVSSSLSWGHGQLERDGYSFLLTLEASHRHELLGEDRPYASQSRYTFDHQGQRYAVDGYLLTPYGSPATLEQQATANSPARYFNAAYQDGQCTNQGLPMPGQIACLHNLYPTLGLYPDENNQRLHARADVLMDNGLTVWGELLWGHSQNNLAFWPWPRATSAYGLQPGSAAYAQAEQAGLDPSITRLLWRPELPALRQVSEQSNGRWSLGIKGEHGNWDHNSQLYLAQSTAKNFYATAGSSLYNTLGLTSDTTWNSANVLAPLDANNPLTQTVAGLRQLPAESSGTNTTYGLLLRGSRPLTSSENREIMLGLGLDWRQEQTRYQNERAIQVAGQPGFQASRQVLASFTELQVPVTRTWDVQLGLRTDHYEDLGQTTNAKMASRWAITPEWSLRGAIGSGFRAPSVAQTHSVETPYVWSQVSQSLNCSPEQQAIAQSLRTSSGETGICNPNAPLYVLGNGNPHLKPEKSTQLTWGLAFVPHRNLRIAADFWTVRISDALQIPSPTLIQASPNQYAANYTLLPTAFAQTYGLDPRNMGLLMSMQNLGTQDKAGIDMETQWRLPTPWGLWHVQTQATYLLKSRVQVSPGTPFVSDLGQYSEVIGTVSPRWRSRIVTGMTLPDWSLNLVWNYSAGYQDTIMGALNLSSGVYEALQRKVAPFSTWDVVFQTSLHRSVDLRATVRNLLNQQAPLSFASNVTSIFSANTTYSNLWGRVVELGLTARF